MAFPKRKRIEGWFGLETFDLRVFGWTRVTPSIAVGDTSP
jgi:hypothetical protein